MENKNNSTNFNSINKTSILDKIKVENKIYSEIESIEDEDSADRKEYIIETEFKGSRKAFFSNPKAIPLKVGEHIIVDFDNGEDMGVVSQIRNKDFKKAKDNNTTSGIIIRKGNQIDERRLNENRDIEDKVLIFARKEALNQNLEMKFLDIEYKFDRKKLVFYFTADGRIDFRALVKSFAAEYKTRIELKQIGVRDEAQRIGGIGVCGRELCCSKFLTSFVSINVAMARDQNLFVKPEKFSGQCGKLMCCLKFEHDFYLEEKRGLPDLGSTIKFSNNKTAIVNMINVFDKSVTLYYKTGETIVHSKEDFLELIKDVDSKDISARNNSNNKNSNNVNNDTKVVDEKISNRKNSSHSAANNNNNNNNSKSKDDKKGNTNFVKKDVVDKDKNKFSKNIKHKHNKKHNNTKNINKNEKKSDISDKLTHQDKHEKDTDTIKHSSVNSSKQHFNRKTIKGDGK